ncbi:unnamed protein product [Ectocarpus sp. 13 AM-2016]
MSSGDANFEAVLAGLLSPDNAVRKNAESVYKMELETQPAVIAGQLLRCLASAQAELIRTTCAVLIRRVVVPSGPHWARLDSPTRAALRAGLLSAIGNETSNSVARKVCHAVAASASPDAGPWPELLPAVIYTAQSAEQSKKTLAFFLLGAMAETSSETLSGQASSLMQMCAEALSNLSQLATASGAFKAAAAVLQTIVDETEQSAFHAILPQMLKVLSAVLSTGEELEAQEMLESLVQLADVSPLFFRTSAAPLSEAMLAVGSASQLEFCTRAAGVEVLLSLAERAPAVMRKCQSIAPGVLPLAMALTCELDEHQTDWVAGPYDDDVDHDEEAAYGVEAMCRIIAALHGKATIPTALQLVPEYLAGADWRQRRAGLCALGALADSATKAFKEHLPSVAEAAISLLVDPSPRVRFQALQLTGRLSDLYPVDFQGVHHEKVVPAVCGLVSGSSQPVRVRGHAAAAIVNFVDTEDVPEEAVTPHLDALLSALCSCLNGGVPQSVQQCRALTAVACVAKTAEAKFGKYYDSFIPGIKEIVLAAAPKAGTDPQQNDLLLGQAMECAGMIGEAVGRARFKSDGLAMMSTLMKRLGKGGVDGHSQFIFEHVAPACGNLCRALGEDFAMFLPVVLPPLFAALQEEVKFSMEAADPDDDGEECVTDEQTGTQTAVLNIRGLGAQRVTLSTFAIASKQTAARLLFEYAGALEGAFLPHVPASASALIPAVTFRFNEEVRSAAALALAKAYTSSLRADVSMASQLLSPCITVLLEGLQGESQDEARTCMSSALRDVLCACYESGGTDEATGSQLPPKMQAPIEAAAAISEQLVARVKASLDRRVAKEAEFDGEGAWDEEDNELLEEQIAPEEEVMEHLVDSLGYLLKGHGPAYLNVFDTVTAPVFGALLESSQPASLRSNAVCVFDDCVEHCGEGAHKYLPACFPAFMAGIMEESSPTLQMASVYGVQQAAKHAPAFILPRVAEVVRHLVHLINRPDAKDEDSLLVTENAVAALGTLCVSPALSSAVDRSQLLPLWLSHLPLKEDETEARVVHRTLCELVEQQDPNLLGSNLGKVSLVVSVLGQILEACLLDPDLAIVDATTGRRMGRILNGMQTSYPTEVMENAWGGLTQGQKAAIQQACS